MEKSKIDSIKIGKNMVDVSHITNVSTDCNNMEKASDDEYLKKIQNAHIVSEFPSDFDVWTVQEQHNWVCQNMTELYQNAPETLQNMIPAVFRAVDFKRSQDKLPEWMDMYKYRRGQKFVRDNYFSIILTILLGTIYGITFDGGLKPLLVNGKNSTPYLAFKRYFSIRY